MFHDCRDVTVARQVAQICEQNHEVIPVAREFLSNFPRFAEQTVYLTDGCTDVSHSPDLYVNEKAAKIAPIRMTGNYGDEVLRGMVVFRPEKPVPGIFCPDLVDRAQLASRTYASLLQGHKLSFAIFRQLHWHHYGLLALEQTQLSMRTPYLDNDFVRTVYRAPDSALANNDFRLRLISDGSPKLGRITTDLGFGGGHGELLGAVIRKFHHFTVKAEYAYDYGMPQRLAQIDHILAPLHVERFFLGRHKFYHFRVWYRDILSGYVRAVLLDPRSLSRPYVERKGVETVVAGHLRGERNYTNAIHTLLSLELLHRVLLDSQ
jgi:asparagine synthase (glutamine-hydrolysing)